MLESGLFFTLGFLGAALLALMIAPAIWRRAVVLTRQRIESSVPLTLNEIQADKDQLRAEFAMSTRRLELSLENLKERAADQLIEINRRRDEVLALEEEHKAKAERIAELQGQADELRSEMRDREEKLSQTSMNLAVMEAKLEEKAADFEGLERRYREVVDEFDDQKIELVARETRLDGVSDEIRDLRQALKDSKSQLVEAIDERKASQSSLTREKNRSLELEKKMTRMQSQLSDMEARLERRDRDLATLRDKSGDTEARASSAQTTLSALETENVRLKAQLADAALRTEALLKNASGDNIDNAVAIFETERKQLQEDISRMTAERDQLKIELSAVQMSSGEDWEIERRENAIVRERINDLAAQVTVMTAAIEGADSPIHSALANPGSKPRRPSKGKKSSPDEVNSLADRIRALQQAAEKSGSAA